MKVQIKYWLADRVVREETIEGDDLEDECFIWQDVRFNNLQSGAPTFADWWRSATFWESQLDLMDYADHGIRGWVENLLDSSDCPMELYRANDFKIEIITEGT